MIDISPLSTNQELIDLAESHAQEYKSADPFPSIVFREFFDATYLDTILSEFPDLSNQESEKYENKRESKLQGKGELFFGEETKRFMHFMNSHPFLNFLQVLTGIEEPLIGDPYFIGGGQHETKKGGFLKIHADFNKHKTIGLDRRINVLVYLNKEWKEEYGGHFELWDRNMEKCKKRVLPAFNTMAIFSTTDFSYHGLPDPVTCPESMSRKSLALYYYSNGRPDQEILAGDQLHGTIFKARKNNDNDKAALNILNNPKGVLKEFIPPILLKMMTKRKL